MNISKNCQQVFFKPFKKESFSDKRRQSFTPTDRLLRSLLAKRRRLPQSKTSRGRLRPARPVNSCGIPMESAHTRFPSLLKAKTAESKTRFAFALRRCSVKRPVAREPERIPRTLPLRKPSKVFGGQGTFFQKGSLQGAGRRPDKSPRKI